VFLLFPQRLNPRRPRISAKNGISLADNFPQNSENSWKREHARTGRQLTDARCETTSTRVDRTRGEAVPYHGAARTGLLWSAHGSFGGQHERMYRWLGAQQIR
jgi:hypothetical protein